MSSNECLRLAMLVLNNSEWQSSTKYNRFIEAEGANVLFLVTRLLKNQSVANVTIDMSKKVDLECPTFWHVLDALQMSKPSPKISTYKKEFPTIVLNCLNFDIVTRVLVAEALASWSFYYHDINKLYIIVEIGLKRFFTSQQLEIGFNKNKSLNLKSKNWMYFLTHIILIATMYGDITVQNKILFADTILILRNWILLLVSNDAAEKNIEMWLEVLICLYLLEDVQFGHEFQLKTLTMFNTKQKCKNPCTFYHTFALWAFYFDLLKKSFKHI